MNLQVAKDQRLSLNPSQISGACGRLMCCLRYEHDFYVQSRKRFPKEGRILVTSLGEEKVLANDIFGDRVTLRGPEGDTRIVPLAELKAELEQRASTVVEEHDDEAPAAEPLVEAELEEEAPPVRASRAPTPLPGDTPAVDAGDRRPHRRRGRRGGRRGRPGGGAHPDPAARVRPVAERLPRRRKANSVAAYYLTTAIDYANGDPHLGHAFEKIGADAIARYRRMLGDDVLVPDRDGRARPEGRADGGGPRALAAGARGRSGGDVPGDVAPPRHLERPVHPHDSAAHNAGVRALIEMIFEKSPTDFYEKSYEGCYCVGCEAFKQENEIVDGRCMLHPTRVLEWVKERNWFFRLSAYQDFLLAHFEAHPEFLQPESRRNEILSLLRQGLDDISASRARLAWGVPFPRPTSDGEVQTTYVWFDALPELSHRNRISRRGAATALAGAAARDRQGHHALPLR